MEAVAGVNDPACASQHKLSRSAHAAFSWSAARPTVVRGDAAQPPAKSNFSFNSPATARRSGYCPSQTIAIGSFVKDPHEMLHGHAVELTVSEHSDPAEMDAYEELLTDATQGVSTRFARQDYVEEAWRIVDPVLDAATPVYDYTPGTWGPAEVETMVAPEGGWFNPIVR
jgi:hypothetical protein